MRGLGNKEPSCEVCSDLGRLATLHFDQWTVCPACLGECIFPDSVKALIAMSMDQEAGGCVLEHTGGMFCICVIEEGITSPEDLLNCGRSNKVQIPKGLSVWEGKWVEGSGDGEFQKYPEYDPIGEFRQLTAQEWSDLQSGKPIFPENIVYGRRQERLAKVKFRWGIPLTEEGGEFDLRDPPKLTPHVEGYAIEKEGVVSIPLIRARRPGQGDVGKFLDSIPTAAHVVVPCVLSGRLAGMLLRRGFKLSPTAEDEHRMVRNPPSEERTHG